MEVPGDLGKRGFSGGEVLKAGLGWAQGRIQGKVSSFQAFCYKCEQMGCSSSERVNVEPGGWGASWV